MTYQRLPYDDAATTAEMVTDAAAVGRELQLPAQGDAANGRHPLGSSPTPVVPDDLAELAAGLELHLD
ncbi:MAG: hypothetical protein QOK15_1969 [Nocardioidaceae bacterium]|nr:hypothetical protein [Nocardioidaceae bacterium]